MFSEKNTLLHNVQIKRCGYGYGYERDDRVRSFVRSLLYIVVVMFCLTSAVMSFRFPG